MKRKEWDLAAAKAAVESERYARAAHLAARDYNISSEHPGALWILQQQTGASWWRCRRAMARAARHGLVERPLSWGSFELFNGVGSVLWAGAAIGTGMLFQTQIGMVLLQIRHLGTEAGELTLVIVLLYVAYKWWERRRFNAALRLPRIEIEELRSLIAEGKAPIIVDVRSSLGRDQDRRCIPGALEMSLDEILARLGDIPEDREVVFYCACPNEASAALACRRLMDRGYSRVRPLKGGLDAWVAAGYEVEIRAGEKAPAAVAAARSAASSARAA